jgi:hypothetical protein
MLGSILEYPPPSTCQLLLLSSKTPGKANNLDPNDFVAPSFSFRRMERLEARIDSKQT